MYPRLTLRACANDSDLFTFNNGTNEEQDAFYFYEVSKYVHELIFIYNIF